MFHLGPSSGADINPLTILCNKISFSCSKAVSSHIPREENPTLQHHDTEVQRHWQCDKQQQDQHVFRTLGFVWLSHHGSPPDACHRKWKFAVLWWESFIATILFPYRVKILQAQSQVNKNQHYEFCQSISERIKNNPRLLVKTCSGVPPHPTTTILRSLQH